MNLTNAIGLLLGLGLSLLFSECSRASEHKAIQSEVLKTEANELVLVQEVMVEAAVGDVWKAYTTSNGWMAWASPLAVIDLRAGGTIKTHYGKDAKIGDDGTNTLYIVNYVPERLLTLRAELSERWPIVMKEDDGKLMNVIVFESVNEKRTRIISYGVGYRDLPAYKDLMKFFVPANEGLFRKLKQYLEK
jgi:uncharacterized protein YndB with AHSA1/START domain